MWMECMGSSQFTFHVKELMKDQEIQIKVSDKNLWAIKNHPTMCHMPEDFTLSDKAVCLRFKRYLMLM